MPRYEVCIHVELPDDHPDVDELEYMVDVSHNMTEALGLFDIPKIVDYAMHHASEDYPNCELSLGFVKEIQYVH
jgi:hypothetical protein|tara:strand:+ start:94 stop:315 length:222 start_codon:yes stop_codon:yes gene_type:complete